MDEIFSLNSCLGHLQFSWFYLTATQLFRDLFFFPFQQLWSAWLTWPLSYFHEVNSIIFYRWCS